MRLPTRSTGEHAVAAIDERGGDAILAALAEQLQITLTDFSDSGWFASSSYDGV